MPEIKQLNITDDIIPALDESLSANNYTYTNGILYVEAQDTQLYNTRVFTFGRFHGVIFDVTYPYDGPNLRVQVNAPGDQLAVTMTVDAGGCSVISGWIGAVTGTYGTRTDTKTGNYRYVRISRNRYVIEGFTGGNDYIFVDVSHDKQTWETVAMTGEMANPSTLDDDGWNLFFEFSGNIYLGPILGVDVPPYGVYDFKLRTPAGWVSVANAQHPLKLRLPDNTWATINNREKVDGPKLWLRQGSSWLFVASGEVPVSVPKTVDLFGKVTLNGTVGGYDLVVIGPYKGQYRYARTDRSGGYRFLDIPVDSFPVDIPIRFSAYTYSQPDHTDTVRFNSTDVRLIKNWDFVDPFQSFEHGTGTAIAGNYLPYTMAWQATRSQGAVNSTDAGPRSIGKAADTPGTGKGQQVSARGVNVDGTATDTVGWISVPIAAYMQQALHYQHRYKYLNGLTIKRITVFIYLYGNSSNPTLDAEFGQTPTSDVVPGLNGRLYYQGEHNSPVNTWTWHDDDYALYQDVTIDSPYAPVVGRSFAKETTGDLLYDGPLNVLSYSPVGGPYRRAGYVYRHELPLGFSGIGARYHINVDPGTPGPDGFTNDMTADFDVQFDVS